MSPTKFKPLLAATVMSAIYMAGIPTSAQAAAHNTSLDVNLSVAAQKGSADYSYPEARKDGTRRYIVQMGDSAHVAASSSRDSVDSIANTIEQQQNQFINQLSGALNSNFEVLQQYQYSYNGIALYLTPADAAIVEGMSGVKQVLLDKDYRLQTDAGPQLIGADNLWDGHGAADPDIIFMDGFDGAGPQGNGVVIGVIDSGINSGHPSFAETDGDGYTHTNPLGAGNYLGACDPSNTDQYEASFTCNAKLIGGYDFVNGLEGSGFDIPGPEDENGHGSHTASTAAGNKVDNVPFYGQNLTISGVAPNANVIMYDACYTASDGRGLCPGVSTLSSVEQAIEDGIVDVINYSIGGGTSPWNDPVSMAFLSATHAGIFVSASAGNSGPGAGTLGHNEPWTASVAATTHNRTLENTTMDIGVDPTTQGIDYAPAVDGPALTSTLTAEMRFSGDVDGANVDGCDPYPAGSFTGEIALVDIFTCPFAQKTAMAADAGAVAVVVKSNSETPYLMGGFENETIPSMSIALSHANTAIAEMAGGTVTTTINAPVLTYNGQADVVADFSSRGPSPIEYNKPDVAAPGVSILAAVQDSGGTEPDFGAISGTSMAAPHNAGAAALLMERHRDWSVAEVKSALMMKAVTAGVTKEDGVTPADWFDIGAGRIQVDEADKATFVLDETVNQFLLADPANGGDPKTLNVASLTDFNCEGTCSFTRIIRSVADESIAYEASITGVSGTVSPSSFTLGKNDFQVLQIEVDTAGLTPEEYAFGQLVISDVPVVPVESFSQSVGVEIPDNGYPADMACGQVNVSGVTNPVVGDISVDLDIGHPWIGDLVISVENPNGDLLGLLDEPSTNATADFEAGATVRFIDTATTPGNDSDGCASGNVCELQPDPGANFTTPPSTLADMVATDPNGTWEVCVGDAASILTGPFNGFSINFPTGGSAPAPTLSTMPISVYALPFLPIIDVAPESLDYAMAADTTDSQDIVISNDAAATAALDWNELTTGTTMVKQFEQANLNDNDGIVSDYFDEGSNAGVYSADMFTLNNGASLDQFYFDGFSSNGGDTTANIDAFTVEVYADNAGIPAGDPETAASALHVLTLPLSSPNLMVTPDGEITVNVKAELGSGWSLASGNYWVTGYANFTGADRWNWFAGVQNTGGNGHIIDPSDMFAAGFTTWTDLTTAVAPEFAGLAFNVSTEYDCGAPWLSTAPSSGTGIAVGGSETVSVTVDTTGMAAGTYTAALCIASNDFYNPVVAVPVSVTVTVVP
jgi:subtilisin family serine protease/subtilisin-like proprotein convertase family protein